MKLPDYLQSKRKPQICDNCKWLSENWTKSRQRICLADIDQYAFLDKSTMHQKAVRTGKCLEFKEIDKTNNRSDAIFIDVSE
jgi:hypothetical protein